MSKTTAGLVWVVLCATAPVLHAQLRIDHTGIECIAPGRYAVVLSGIDSGNPIRFARVYFRSSLFPDFYFVDMKLEGDRYVAILPQVAPGTPSVVYYIEAVDSGFNIARSAEYDPRVEDACNDQRSLASLPAGDETGIVVSATTEGQSLLPPGFSAVGIVGTVAAAGAAAGVGAGVSTGVVVAAAAGAAGGVVATQLPKDEETTTTSALPRTTSAPATSTVTTSTIPAATTSVVVSSTTSLEPTTTVVPAGPLNPECFTVEDLDNCTVRLDATCVNQPVDRYEWVLDQSDKWKRVSIPDGEASFDYHWDECGDRSAHLVIRLTVYRDTDSVSRVHAVNVSGANNLRSQQPQPITLQTRLALPPFDGSSQGRLIFDGAASRVIDSAQPAELQVPAAAGVRRIEAVVVRARAEPGQWRFDFGRESRFVRGSLRVLQGNVLSVERSAVVFRLRGQPQEQLAFTIELTR